ncbi:MADS-box transcription factor 15-like [Dorcoceras hygrometricum]|uniref:MADS-box transcription factor 15-like n=1 Tax=Dorcoceras hygrometricum TaxID=472368 RepID=A0A2Z7B7P7_9LAMI|nr:MADS-box transcription factor 15-like [Dorcoceras hygrometricum]
MCSESFAIRFLIEILRAIVRSLAAVVRQFPDCCTTRFSAEEFKGGIRAHQVHNPAGKPKQIALDNQGRTIRRLRAQLATERRGFAATKKELEETQVALEASHKVIAGLTEIGLSMSKKIERMKVKKQKVRANHVEFHQKFQARIHEAEDSMQAQHLLIEALVDEKDSLLQTIHGLQEANNAPAPFDGDWEEEPEEEPEEDEIEDIPLGEGEIDDEYDIF